VKTATPSALGPLVDELLAGRRPERPEVQRLLEVSDPVEAEVLFAAARRMRQRHFGRRVYLYGFVYFSTYCGNRCAFCRYRAGNSAAPRYRRTPAQVVAAAARLAADGCHLIDLTMGEDPALNGPEGRDQLVRLVKAVKEATGGAVMVSPGVVGRDALAALRQAGADWYACYQETHDRALFARLRPGQDFDRRAGARRAAAALGLLVEDGLLVGAGETVAARAQSVLAMRGQGARQVRAMAFVPQPGTPMERYPLPSVLTELVTLATMRLVMPDRLIPASLDAGGPAGLAARLGAGANVVTSLIPRGESLCGVARPEEGVAEGLRSPGAVLPMLAEAGLEPARPQDLGLLRAAPAPRLG